MTSMPASRRARAMTLAPRSWPSRPGFAISTRIFLVMEWRRPLSDLRDGDFFVGAEGVAHGVADFAEGGVGFDSVINERHQIVFAFGCVAERGKPPCDFIAGTVGAEFVQTLGLAMSDGIIDLQNFEWLFFRHKRVDADHQLFFVVEF